MFYYPETRTIQMGTNDLCLQARPSQKVMGERSTTQEWTCLSIPPQLWGFISQVPPRGYIWLSMGRGMLSQN